MIDAPFIPGLELARHFYDDAVATLMAERFPGVFYAAARLGGGSDVLGFDTSQSRDHDWGPRLALFLPEDNFDQTKTAVNDILRRELPSEVAGYPTHYEKHEDGTLGLAPHDGGPIRHNVRLTTVARFFRSYLAYDPIRAPTTVEWLSFPQQRLRTVADGAVFRDDTGQLTAVRRQLGYYPEALWRYLMSVQWRRLAQEEAFVGRGHQVGDERGARLIAARLAQELMRLAFLQERRYWPYSKWFGSAFGRLEIAPKLGPLLDGILATAEANERENQLNAALSLLAEGHNALALTVPLATAVAPFHGRPFDVLHCDRFSHALWETLPQSERAQLRRHVGGIDQFVDSTDVLAYPEKFRRLRPWLGGGD